MPWGARTRSATLICQASHLCLPFVFGFIPIMLKQAPRPCLRSLFQVPSVPPFRLPHCRTAFPPRLRRTRPLFPSPVPSPPCPQQCSHLVRLSPTLSLHCLIQLPASIPCQVLPVHTRLRTRMSRQLLHHLPSRLSSHLSSRLSSHLSSHLSSLPSKRLSSRL
jgi:hypothetical protein